jgi:tripartite motif-containing protein 2/3/tripartite motif-containing protein 71
MAEKILQKVEDQLNCSVCLDTYTDPKLLQCFHVYCRQCLARLVDRNQQGHLFLSCPICRQITPVPDRGVAGLQTAFHINRLLDIVGEHSVEGSDKHDSSVAELKTPLDSYHCLEHPDKELELYCETCEMLVCFHCTLKNGKHHSHDYELLDAAFEKYKGNIASSLEPMQRQVAIVDGALSQLNRHCEMITVQQASIEDSIHRTVGRLHKALDDRKIELINKLNQVTQRKLKSLASQRDQIETIQAQLHSCLRYMDESSRTTDSHREVLKMKTIVARQVKELTTTFQPSTLRPNMEADIVFSIPVDVTAAIKIWGAVSSPSLPDPTKCHITMKGTEPAVLGQISTVTLQSINHMGAPCNESLKVLECELVSELTGTIAKCNVARIGQSQYAISYKPIVKGRHLLHIKVDDRHVSGSPFSVAIKSLIEKVGLQIPLTSTACAQRPWGVVVTQNRKVVVTEYDGNCISMFSPDMKKLQSIGSYGSGKGQFNCPCGVTVDGDGDILVADSHNHRIQKFTADGQFVTTVGSRGKDPLQFECPLGITFNTTNNKVYVVDVNCVQVLHSDLTFCHTFGRRGTGKGQFNLPWDVACDSTGKVYVTDSRNNRIQVFTAKGKFLRVLSQGRAAPVCLAIDTSNRVYVSNESSSISVFSPEGHLVAEFGKEGEGPGEFKSVRGLAVDNNGVLYVCDRENNRIQLF